MATPAAVLAIVVAAQTAKATADLKKVERQVDKLDGKSAFTKLGAVVDQGGFKVHGALVTKAGLKKASAKLGFDVDQGSVAKAFAIVEALDAKDVEIEVDFDRSLLGRIKGVSQALTGFGTAAGGAGGEAGGFGAKLGGLAGPLGSMGPLLGGVAVAATVLGAALAALTASLGAAIAGLGALAIGAAGAMTVGFGGVAAIAAPAISALSDLMSAQEAANKAQSTGSASAAATAKANAQAVTAAQQQVADSIRGVTAAEQQLASAQRSVQVAQEFLTQARFEATRQLQDMRLAAMQSETSEKRARLSIAQAEANLRSVMNSATASRLDIRDAELSVTEARQNLRNVTVASNRAQQDYNRAQKGGISQMPSVLSAQRSLNDALRSVKTAQVGVADAHRSVGRALENLRQQQQKANQATGAGATQMAALALAAKKAGPAAVRFSHHLKEMGRRWKGLTRPGTADFFGLLSDGLDRLNNKMPLLARSANRSMRALRRGFNAFLDAATGPEFNKFIRVMTRTFEKSIGPFSKAFGNIAKVLQRIAVAVAPLIVKMARGFEDLTEGWLRGTKSGKEIREVIKGLVGHLVTWVKLSASFGKTFLTLMEAMAPAGKGLADGITRAFEAFNKWASTKEGKKQIQDFMEAMIDLAKALTDLFIALMPVLIPVIEIVARLATPLVKAITLMQKFANATVGKLLVALKGALRWVNKHWGDIGHTLGAPFRWGFNAAKDAFEWLKDKVERAVFVTKVRWGQLRGILGGPFKWVIQAAKDAFNWVVDKVKRAVHVTKVRWGQLKDILKAPFKGLAGFVSDAFKPIKDAIRWVIDKVEWLLDKIPDIKVPGASHVAGMGGSPEDVVKAARQARRHGGQHGGLVTEQGIVPIFGMQRGGVVGGRGQPPGPKDTAGPFMLQPGELVIPKKVVDETRKNAKLAGKALTGELGKAHEVAGKDSTEFVKDHGKKMEKLRSVASSLTQRFRKSTITDFEVTGKRGSDFTERLRGNVNKDFDRMRSQTTTTTNRMRGNVTDGFDSMRERTTKSSQKMEKGVGGNFRDMAGAVGDGLNKIAKMTNQALKALGVKTLDFGTKVQKKQKGGPVKAQRGGRIDMPGVPATGDHIPALLEKNEYVVNSKASKKHRALLNKINFSDAPRFQAGGPVKMASGGVPGDSSGLHASILSLLRTMVSRFGGSVSDGVAPRSLHQTGQAADYVPNDWAGASRYANQVGPSLLEGIYNPGNLGGSAVSWDTGQQQSHSFWGSEWGNHLDHLHLAVADGTKIAGAVATEIKKVLITGPDGPLKDMGQAALDKVRAAANALIDRKSAATGDAMIPDVGGPVVAQMGKILLANNFSRAGAAGIIGNAYRESLWNPGAVGTGGGGLFGFTTSPVSLADMQAFAKRKGKPWTDVGTQMEFMLSGSGEGGLMSGSYYNGLEAFLKSTKNVHDATYRFMDEWERPGVEAFGDRLAGAHKAYGMSTWQEGGPVGMKKGGDVGDMSIRRLLGISRRGKGDDDQKALDELLDRIHAESSAPVKPQGQLHDWMEKLELLELKKKYHPKSKVNTRKLNVFVRAHAKKMIHQLHRRGEKYKELRERAQIASHTPGQKDDERIQDKIDKFLGTGKNTMLEKIREARKGVPIRPFGNLKEHLDELDLLLLQKTLPGKEGKRATGQLKKFLKGYDGKYVLGALKYRGKIWKELKTRRDIAKITPGKADDKKIAEEIEKFLGKKPGGDATDGDAFAQTEAFFEFLRLLGPTSMPTFAKGGKLAAGRFGIAGERGPELIQGPATVTPAPQTASMLSPQITILIEDGAVDANRIKVLADGQIVKNARVETRKARAGVTPSR